MLDSKTVLLFFFLRRAISAITAIRSINNGLSGAIGTNGAGREKSRAGHGGIEPFTHGGHPVALG
jgi:hypothetical protein